jgi:ABC-type nitrate/sulfonate/bicarbonate transport system substrate-binding protein
MAMMRVHRHRVAAAFGLILTVFLAPPAMAQLAEFKAGVADRSNSDLAWWMAVDGGFFVQQGLKVEIVLGDGNRGLEALQAGRLDVIHRGLSNVVRVNRSGGDLRLVGSLGDKIRLVFFSAAGVMTAADLKGGVVAISNIGAESDIAVTLALQWLGLTREDVTINEFGGTRERLAAIKSGAAKATMLAEPFTSLAREEGVHVLVDLAGEKIPWVFTGIAARQSATTSNRDKLKRFLKATIEGNYLAFTDERRAKAALSAGLSVTDPKSLDISYKDYTQQTPLDAEISQKAAENTLAQFPGGSTRIEDYIDVSLLDEIKAEGFIAQMQLKYYKR